MKPAAHDLALQMAADGFGIDDIQAEFIERWNKRSYRLKIRDIVWRAHDGTLPPLRLRTAEARQAALD